MLGFRITDSLSLELGFRIPVVREIPYSFELNKGFQNQD